MSKAFMLAVASALLAAPVLGAGAPSHTASAKPAQSQQKAFVYDDSPLGVLAGRLFPVEKLDHVKGFFAPVVKRYQASFDNFAAEYAAAPNKLAIVAKHLPEANRALAAARRMKIPAKYEKEKAEYIRLFETLLASARVAVKLSGAKPPPPQPRPTSTPTRR